MALLSSSWNSLFPIPSQVPSARFQHAYVNMNTDAFNPTRGASADDIQHQLNKRAVLNSSSCTFIDSLWDNPANQDLVFAFLNNKFCLTCAQGTDQDCLSIYQRYSVQDYFYLEDYVKYKALRLSTIPQGDLLTVQSEAESVYSDANYTISAAQSYVTDLHGKAIDLAEGNRNVPELAYGNVLQNSASKEDWFNLHVLIIPCIYGWGLLAERLLNDPLTKNDTIFYKTWIQPNSDPSYGNDLSTFLDANQALWKDEIDTGTGYATGKWNILFRTALKLEIALFASAFDQ